MKRTAVLAMTAFMLILAPGCSSSPSPENSADIVYFGGPILTVNDAQPNAEAVAVKDGKILQVGSRAELEKNHKGASTQMIDLGGKTMTPGFIDGHSHFIFAMAVSKQANCTAPPVGPVKNIADLIATLQAFQKERNIPKGEIIMCYGYDGNELADKREMTRGDLDKAFPDNPVVAIHISGHGAVLNSAAMKKFGFSSATKTPPGGVILRKPGSQEPAGLVMETAYLPVFAGLPQPTKDQEAQALKDGQMIYAAAGITTAQEGATHANDLAVLERGADQNAFFIDIVSYPFILDLDKVLGEHPPTTFGTYHNHLKLGGVKIVSDGSPQGKTAFFTTPYLTGGPSGQKNWKGEPTFPQEELNAMVKKVYDDKLQLLVHANGDAAIDMALKAHEAAGGDLAAPRRTVIIHSQFVRKDQLQKYLDYKMIPSMFTDHVFFFGDVHKKNRGQEQAYFISPMNTALKMGLHPSNHTDFNVGPIDQTTVMWTAVNRTSRSGELMGADERITPAQALRAITLDAAYQYFEEGSKGSIEAGKRADLVILDQNPLTVDPSKIIDIKVMETIKDGKSVYKRAQ